MDSTEKELVIHGCGKFITVNWKISKWENYECGDRVLSPGFSTPFLGCQKQWFIACWPNGNKIENEGFVSCAVFTRNNINYTCRISYNAHSGNDIKVARGEFVSISRLCEYRNYSTFNLKCSITINIEGDSHNQGDSLLLEAISQSKYQVCKDLERLLLDKDDTDFEIIGTNLRIPSHKNILSSRSSVFMAMFSSGMKENHENSVKIEDVDDEVLEDMVKYIYSGTSPNLAELAPKLIVAADKYDLPNLKDLCELQLIKNISVENFCSTFSLSDQIKLKKLKASCLRWGSNKMDKIVQTKEFKEIMFSKPELMLYIIQHLSSSHIDEWLGLTVRALSL